MRALYITPDNRAIVDDIDARMTCTATVDGEIIEVYGGHGLSRDGAMCHALRDVGSYERDAHLQECRLDLIFACMRTYAEDWLTSGDSL